LEGKYQLEGKRRKREKGRTEYEFWSFSLEPVARMLGE
jgi:hypothetical protein